MMRTTLWMVLLLATSCGAKQQPASPEPMVAITLDGNGLHPFPGGEVNSASLREAYQGYTIATNDGQHFAVRDGGNTVLHVDKAGDSVRAKVTGELVMGPNGIRVGSDWAQVGALADVQCRRGAEPWTDTAFCTSESLPGIVFGFDIEGVQTPGCSGGCAIEHLEGLAGTTVRFMDWQPQ